MAQPVLAILLGIVGGFALVVPVGGLPFNQQAGAGEGAIIRCDVMGCQAQKK
jgi:hypothetical protein